MTLNDFLNDVLNDFLIKIGGAKLAELVLDEVGHVEQAPGLARGAETFFTDLVDVQNHDEDELVRNFFLCKVARMTFCHSL